MDPNRLIYRVLWVGVLLSMAVILLGLVAKGISTDSFPRTPTGLAVLPAQVIQFTPAGLLSLGVFLMILTPMARVLLSIFLFAAEHDSTYVGITGLVFLNLMLGVALSLLLGVG